MTSREQLVLSILHFLVFNLFIEFRSQPQFPLFFLLSFLPPPQFMPPLLGQKGAGLPLVSTKQGSSSCSKAKNIILYLGLER